MKVFQKFKTDNRGIGIVEIILILVVLIALVILFRNEITQIVTDILGTITGSGDTLKKQVPDIKVITLTPTPTIILTPISIF